MQRKPILTPLIVQQEPALSLLFWWFFSLGCFPVFQSLSSAVWLAWVGYLSKFTFISGAIGWGVFHLIGAKTACKCPTVLLPAGIILTAVSITALYPLATWTFDLSYDGNWYHLKAINYLVQHGWNPYFENVPNDSYPNGELYVNHYAKASWFASASWVKLFEVQDLGKINQVLIILGALGAGLTIAFQESRNRWMKALLIVCAVFNPVSINLMFSHYIDGELASGLLLLMFGMYQAEKSSSRSLGLFLLLLAVYIANLKFTGLMYVMLIGGAWTFRQMWIAQLSPGMFIISILLFGLLGIGGLGYPTYVRNYQEKGNVFYPLLGEGNVYKNVSEACYPKDFYNTNRLERFYKSNIAEPAFVRSPMSSERRPFFQIPKDLGNYDMAAPELNSFVPFFQEIVAFSLLLLLILTLQKKITFPGWALLIILISPVFWLEQNWMARYIPQLWFAPLLILWHSSNRKRPGIISYFLLVLISVNLFIIHVRFANRQYKENKNFHEWLSKLKTQRKVELRLGWMGCDELRIKQAGIKWVPLKGTLTEDEKDFAPFFGWLHGLHVRKKANQ